MEVGKIINELLCKTFFEFGSRNNVNKLIKQFFTGRYINVISFKLDTILIDD